MGKPVAVVTGANRGIGLEIVRNLCKNFHGDVILTSRRTKDGEPAVRLLKKEGLNPRYHELDLSLPDSIWMFRHFIEERYGGIDILVLNGSVTFEPGQNLPVFMKAGRCFEVDIFGNINAFKICHSLFRPHCRIVILTNGYLSHRKCLSGDVAKKFKESSSMELYDLEVLAKEYLKAVKYGTHTNVGWPDCPSQVCKIFLSTLSEVLARLLKDDRRQNMLVNACCPGWTDSGGSQAYRGGTWLSKDERLQTPGQAASDVVWLALLPPGTKQPFGKVVRHKEIIDVT